MFWITALLGFIFIPVGSLGHMLMRSWPRSLIAFAVQSLGVGLIAWQIAPLPLALAKCIIGWLAATLIAVTLIQEGDFHRKEMRSGVSSFFRAAILLLMGSVVVSLFPSYGDFFRNPPPLVLLLSGWLIGAGVVNLALSEHPFRIGFNLLTVLQGFELGYLWMEQSLLVLGLLAAVDLAIILAASTLHSYNQAGPLPESHP